MNFHEVGERTAVFSETALAAAKMEFYVTQDRRLGKVYEAEAHHKRGAMDVTKFHFYDRRLNDLTMWSHFCFLLGCGCAA